MLHSTTSLLSSTANVVVKTCCLPFTVPLRITSSVAGTAIYITNGTISSIQSKSIQLLQHFDANMKHGSSNSAADTSESISSPPHEIILNAAIDFVPFAIHTASQVKDGIGSTLINLLAGQDPDQSSSDPTHVIARYRTDAIIDTNRVTTRQHTEVEAEAEAEEVDMNIHACAQGALTLSQDDPIHNHPTSSAHAPMSENKNEPIRSIIPEVHIRVPRIDCFILRVCDLNLYSTAEKSKLVYLELRHNSPQEYTAQAVDNMVEIALSIASDSIKFNKMAPAPASAPALHEEEDGNKMIHHRQQHQQQHPPVRWKEEGSTSKHIKKFKGKWNTAKAVDMLEKELLVWSGSMKTNHTGTYHGYYGGKIPLFKARGIISDINPTQLLEIFMDSSKVQMYNKFSIGRRDICILQDLDGMTKIVENESKVPFSGKIITMQTFLHARPLHGNDNANDEYIIISRSTEVKLEQEDQDKVERKDHRAQAPAQARPGSHNEIIWGVNILRKVHGHSNKVDLTNFTQANSSTVPNFLAQKVRVYGGMAMATFILSS